MQERFKEILDQFALDPAAGKNALRDLLAADRKRFCADSLELLKSGLEGPDRESLVSLLAERDLLTGPLCDSSLFSRAEAKSLAQLASRFQPLLDTKLARLLPELEAPEAERVLAILEAISDGSRIVPLLAPLLRQSNPRLRSKAALLIGRSIKRVEWAEGFLKDADSRTRANVVEALAGIDSPAARALLGKACHDPNWRVATNALVALYKLGDPAAVPRIVKESQSQQAEFRSAAARAMGETGDSRFLPILERMVPEPLETVGRSIARARERIELAAVRLAQGGSLRVQVVRAESLPDGTRRLRVMAAPADGWEPLGLKATQFAVWESSELVLNYRVQAPVQAEPLVVGFALCSDVDVSDQDLEAARAAVLQCVEHKRVSDSWAVIGQADEAVRFTSEKPALRRALQGAAQISHSSSGSADALSRVIERAAQLRGARNLIVLAGPKGFPTGAFPMGRPDLGRILKYALETKTAIHAVELGDFAPPHELEPLCRQTGGIFLAAAAADQMLSLYRQIYCSLLNHYEIFYRTEGNAGGAQAPRVRLQVHSEQGCGEDSVEIEAGSKQRL